MLREVKRLRNISKFIKDIKNNSFLITSSANEPVENEIYSARFIGEEYSDRDIIDVLKDFMAASNN